jgi:hypothetical protein
MKSKSREMKPNLYRNGEFKKLQAEVIPKGYKLLQVPKYKLWLTVPKKWTKEQCEKHRQEWIESYENSLGNRLFRY